ncbi:universal stress protein [Halomonas sp. M5N1S17]|uniref:universal stress protein n=1 Tax=Halomonas alkalisoli TaxID=2907158 RepID=UPI001F3E14F4|nr:universal stress protein [Halomonas alkalisoli]MCE9664265.1 universal stress protein [Halomonas alkalisoli]
MMQSILLAIDSSPSAEVARRYAIDMARRLEGTVHAVFVIDSRLTEFSYFSDESRPGVVEAALRLREQTLQQLEEQGELLLEAVKAEIEAAGIECRVDRLSGVPAVRILDAASDSDLIVMGRRGESAGLGDTKGLGEVVERVLRTADQPVLLAGADFQEITQVLLGFDGSKPAREAMNYAIELAQRLVLPVRAVSVHHEEHVARRHLETVELYAASHKVKVDTDIRKGDPADVILSMAQPGDLITIGAFGEGRIREWLLGSTTETILRSAAQPVLLHR